MKKILFIFLSIAILTPAFAQTNNHMAFKGISH